MSQSVNNSFQGTITAGGNFEGRKEAINGAISIICALYTTVDLLIETYQSPDGITYYSFNSFLHDVSVYGTHTRTQFYIDGRFGYIKVSNNTASNATGVLFSTLYSANNHDGTLQQPSYIQGNVNISSIVPITGSVDITARSGTGFLSYLTDNVAVATMPAITGTVAVSSQPNLSYLTDNVAVATMPAITGTVAVSSQPPLSYLTDNIAVATMPAITGVVSLTNSLNTVTYNSGPISGPSYTSPSFDLNENSLFDCLLYATGTIIAGNLRLDYSTDNIDWTPNNSSNANITVADPHYVYLGIKSGSRYVRVSSGPTSSFTTSVDLRIIFSSKRD
jgi:hypothetical protein